MFSNQLTKQRMDFNYIIEIHYIYSIPRSKTNYKVVKGKFRKHDMFSSRDFPSSCSNRKLNLEYLRPILTSGEPLGLYTYFHLLISYT